VSQSIGGSIGNFLDELIAEQILKAIHPSALEISLKIAEDIEAERKNLLKHWNARLERAHYEVERAYRQYNVIEPENRLVARTLEKKWEEALIGEEKLKQEYALFLSQEPAALSQTEREAIRKLAEDIPSLWSAPTTTNEERQQIARLLIERVMVKVEGNTEKVSVEIHWVGGHKTYADCRRPVAKLRQLSYYEELITRVETLQKENRKYSEVAEILNREGWKPPKVRESFNAGMVSDLLGRRGVRHKQQKHLLEKYRLKNEWTLGELSQKTQIPEPTLYQWMRKNRLQVRRVKEMPRGGVWLVTADEEEIKQLKSLKDQPKEWVNRSLVKRVE
jgi:hypothetical protein